MPPTADASFMDALRRKEAMPDARSRHQMLIRDYQKYFPIASSSSSSANNNSNSHLQPTVPIQTEYDILKKHHCFIRNDDDDRDLDQNWEKRIAKKYYDKLFKEYCLVHLGKYRHHQIALRWRTEREVVHGKGQFVCGALDCEEELALRSWEVNFKYKEQGERKQALVKVRLCPMCTDKLHFAQKVNKSGKDREGDKEQSDGKRQRKGNEQRDASDEDDEQQKRRKLAADIWSRPDAQDQPQAVTQDQEFDAFFSRLFE